MTAIDLTLRLWLGAMLCAIGASTCGNAKAQDAEPLLVVAQVCYLEATWQHHDCAAIVAVAKVRAARVGQPWLSVLRRYSALDNATPRAREVRALGWHDMPDRGPRWNRDWSALRSLVQRIDAGEVPNPCPGAEHWGGTMDAPRARMLRVECMPATANTFYRLGPKTISAADAAATKGRATR